MRQKNGCKISIGSVNNDNIRIDAISAILISLHRCLQTSISLLSAIECSGVCIEELIDIDNMPMSIEKIASAFESALLKSQSFLESNPAIHNRGIDKIDAKTMDELIRMGFLCELIDNKI